MVNLSFIQYSSIDNYNDAKREENFDNFDWIVCEKIHGANFSFITNGDSIVCARRSSIIKSGEEFFGYQRIFKKYKDSIMDLWKVMNDQQKIRGLNKQIIVYGELFGGYYPHPLVKPVKDIKPVQKGIYYCPEIEWKAFDINDGEDFVEWDTMKTLLNDSNVPFVGELSRGSFLECKDYNPEFSSTIPQEFHLPSFQNLNFMNKVEGIVIRPLKNLLTTKGDRVILKIKTQDFDERTCGKVKPPEFSTLLETSNDQGNANISYLYNTGSYEKKVNSVNPKIFLSFVNKNRLESVISKVGNLTQENKEQFITLLFEDAMDDINKCIDMKEKFSLMSKKNKKKVNRLLFAESKEVIQRYIENDKE
ncbi:hypothetical protein C1645_817038 [Glomus cerebriforme]|uniref:RNA ligase domain-containing protein n=1 Tax=Glomus cerebriforme TaxID=658196 RepID=A0A397TA95_9GLOM|nr:hypothetical protein C1645_817038 [Glomus cerebriforme]